MEGLLSMGPTPSSFYWDLLTFGLSIGRPLDWPFSLLNVIYGSVLLPMGHPLLYFTLILLTKHFSDVTASSWMILPKSLQHMILRGGKLNYFV